MRERGCDGRLRLCSGVDGNGRNLFRDSENARFFGQTVFHAHLHVIPRFAAEPHAGKGIRYWLKQESNRR